MGLMNTEFLKSSSLSINLFRFFPLKFLEKHEMPKQSSPDKKTSPEKKENTGIKKESGKLPWQDAVSDEETESKVYT